jgi:hypothetical protein
VVVASTPILPSEPNRLLGTHFGTVSTGDNGSAPVARREK